MGPLKSNPSKTEELAHLTAFIETLPADSYLCSMFVGCEEYAKRAMENDVVGEPLETLKRYRHEIEEDTRRLTLTAKELQAKVDFLRAERSRLLRIADYISDQAEQSIRAANAACREIGTLQTLANQILLKAQQ